MRLLQEYATRQRDAQRTWERTGPDMVRRASSDRLTLGHELLRACFGARGSKEGKGARGVRIAVPNPVLGGAPTCEIWRSEQRVRRGIHGDVAWAKDGSVLFGGVERQLRGGVEEGTRSHFEALLATLEIEGCPHLLRIWNFLPGINEEEGGIERYRLFNAGRAAAFEEHFGTAEAEARYCASSAVGTRGQRLVTWFAASRTPGIHFGSPRQVDAFRYPKQYGARPPSFSRATIAPPELGSIFFLSGTASIVGHATRHAESISRQLDETLRNIDALLGSEVAGHSLPSLAELDQVRVYLRHAGDLEAVREPLLQRIGSHAALAFIEADLCRAELLLEIEGIAGLHRTDRS